MPKIKPLTEREAKNRKIQAELAGQMKFYQKNAEDVAEYLGVSRGTFYRRKSDPETFTLREMRALKTLFPGIEFS